MSTRKISIKKRLNRRKLTVQSKNVSYKIDRDLFKKKIKGKELIHKINTRRKTRRSKKT
jgi:hypothetical protein